MSDFHRRRAPIFCIAIAFVLVGMSSAFSAEALAQVNLSKAVAAMQRYNVEGSDPNTAEIALKCLALTDAYELGEASVKPEIQNLASRLISLARKDPNNGKIGWGLQEARTDKRCTVKNAFDMFNTGHCDLPRTNYMYQTPLALTCLAQASLVTGNKTFGQYAAKTLSAIEDLGTMVKGCNDCFHYWDGYSPNDAGRYVRNTNDLMGMANAWTFVATREPKFKRRAEQVANSEMREVNARNYGYFGIDDLRYQNDPADESFRIENHVPLVAKGLADLGSILGRSDLQRAAVTVMKSWLFCSSTRCLAETCRDWGANYKKCPGGTYTLAPCFVRRLDPNIGTACVAATANVPITNPYQLWAAISEQAQEKLLRTSNPTK